MRRRCKSSILLALSLLGAIAAPAGAQDPAANPIDGKRAYGYLKQLCNLGPRWSGSPGMVKQQRLLEEHFKRLGGQVKRQEFAATNPELRQKVQLANLIIEWHPDRERRILLCAHYDTRPLPNREPPPKNKTGTFLGANDGASGTALLMELAHLMPQFDSAYGVDFVLFDGEELVYDDNRGDPYFLGSMHFANEYVRRPPAHKYRWGVLFDMVGDADLQLYREQHSYYMWPDTRPLVRQIWDTAGRLGVEEFKQRTKHLVRDDHLPLRNIANIPTCDIIDFDYPTFPRNRFWHTEADTPDKCSGESLEKVGWVIYEWLKDL